MAREGAGGRETVAIVEADPDLVRGLPARDAHEMRRRIQTHVIQAAPGQWAPPPGERPPVGLLVLDGLIARHVVLAGIGCTELIGRGDLLRPWDQGEGYPSIPTEIDWTVIEPARIALLDQRFARAMGHWPALAVNLLSRSVRQSQSSAIHLAITCLTGVEVRLHVLLWHLADRWGRAGPEGVVVPVPLTHKMLGRLVRAGRPSVTIALKRLGEGGLVTRRDDGSWLLHGAPPAELPDFVAQTADERDRGAAVR